MTFFSGSGNASDIKTQMQTTIPAHSAWSLVESTTFGASSYAADVYKCDHAVSGLSADFYMMVLLNGSSLYLGIAEGYNASTHKPKRPAMAATSSLVTLQSDGGLLSATTEIDWYDGTSGGLSVATNKVGILTTSQQYQIVVAKDALILVVYFSLSSSAVSYCGAYETTLGAGDDPLPILVSANTSTGAGKAYSTRHPRRGGLATGYACNLNGASTNDGSTSLAVPSTGADFTPLAAPGSMSGDAYDAYRGNDPGAAKIAVLNSYGTTVGIGRASNGWRRGWMRHLRYTPTTGLTPGDTVSIDGQQYIYGSTGGIWVAQDPA